jgi:hypothetical protein
VFSAIDLMLVAGADEIGDRQETRATEPMLKAALYSRLTAGSPITKNAHMRRYGRVGWGRVVVLTGVALLLMGFAVVEHRSFAPRRRLPTRRLVSRPPRS